MKKFEIHVPDLRIGFIFLALSLA